MPAKRRPTPRAPAALKTTGGLFGGIGSCAVEDEIRRCWPPVGATVGLQWRGPTKPRCQPAGSAVGISACRRARLRRRVSPCNRGGEDGTATHALVEHRQTLIGPLDSATLRSIADPAPPRGCDVHIHIHAAKVADQTAPASGPPLHCRDQNVEPEEDRLSRSGHQTARS